MAQRALLLALYVALPMLAAALTAGLAASAVQSALRQSDPTVSVVPRILAAGGALLVFGGWMVAMLGGFWLDLWTALPEMLR
ncbi:MAG: flagellar biosynthetic protein FliQ [Armatimonadota bacterium]